MMDLKRLDWILTKSITADLTPWEDHFIADMINRREKHGDSMTISEKQEEVLERIAEK